MRPRLCDAEVMSSPAELFVAALGAGDRALAEPSQRELDAHRLVDGGDIDEARACLSAACRALDLSFGGSGTHNVHTGDDAFREQQWAQGVSRSLDPQRSQAAAVLITALELATDRLGPVPGGGIGNFRSPTQPPAVVSDTPPPTSRELGEMASACGEAVALLTRGGHVNGMAVLSELLASVGMRHAGGPST